MLDLDSVILAVTDEMIYRQRFEIAYLKRIRL
jgi:hypothetical protein